MNRNNRSDKSKLQANNVSQVENKLSNISLKINVATQVDINMIDADSMREATSRVFTNISMQTDDECLCTSCVQTGKLGIPENKQDDEELDAESFSWRDVYSETSQNEDNVMKMECDVKSRVDVGINKATQHIRIQSTEHETSNDSHSKRKGSSEIKLRDQEFEEFIGKHDVKEELDEQDDQVQSTSTDYLVENEGDFHQCFGKYVASLLSKMPPQKALELQPKILRLIFSNFEEN